MTREIRKVVSMILNQKVSARNNIKKISYLKMQTLNQKIHKITIRIHKKTIAMAGVPQITDQCGMNLKKQYLHFIKSNLKRVWKRVFQMTNSKGFN
jgi:hypothetical protein